MDRKDLGELIWELFDIKVDLEDSAMELEELLEYYGVGNIQAIRSKHKQVIEHIQRLGNTLGDPQDWS